MIASASGSRSKIAALVSTSSAGRPPTPTSNGASSGRGCPRTSVSPSADRRTDVRDDRHRTRRRSSDVLQRRPEATPSTSATRSHERVRARRRPASAPSSVGITTRNGSPRLPHEVAGRAPFATSDGPRSTSGSTRSSGSPEVDAAGTATPSTSRNATTPRRPRPAGASPRVARRCQKPVSTSACGRSPSGEAPSVSIRGPSDGEQRRQGRRATPTVGQRRTTAMPA